MMNSEALAEAATAAKGRIMPFGKYLLLSRVSVGGMAEVFKAIPEGAQRIDEIVAIKRILPNIAEDDEFIGMFIDEARIAGQLNHPNICRIYELGRVGEDHYISMQFLWGRDLLKVMNRFKRAGEPMPPALVALIAAKACAALHYAHNKRDAAGVPLNIIHRDVSPQNIIVGYGGQVKLIDFGVARAASQSQRTQAGILKGKFGYMSPEMIRGLPVDHRSDVFAMGICLHEALTGSRLFYGETDFATLELVRDAKVDPPSRKAPDVPRELDEIVLGALARDVERRNPSAEHLQHRLEAFVARHYPGFGEADVGAIMRQAFGYEVSREKERLAVFSDMLQHGRLKRGAVVPPLPSESTAPSSGEQVADGQKVIGAPPMARPAEEPTSEPPQVSVHDEKTQIFFSADELDEIREIDGELGDLDPVSEPRQPAISDVILRGGSKNQARASDSLLPTPSFVGKSFPPTSGTYPRGGHNGARAPLESLSPYEDQRRVPTMTLPAALSPEVSTAHITLPAAKSGRNIALVLLAAALVAVGYLLVQLLAPRVGAIEIAGVDAKGALVRVDGVVRGNPPLRVSDLSPGLHTVELQAKGYVVAERTLRLGAGEVRQVSLVLERETALQREKIAPVVETEPLAPDVQALPSSTGQATKERREKRERLKEKLDTDALEEAQPVAEQAVIEGDPEGDPPPVDDGMGELLISTLPWSHVFVDDVDSGRDTPVRALKIAPGPHRVGLRTPDGFMHTVDVYIEAGQVVRIIRRF